MTTPPAFNCPISDACDSSACTEADIARLCRRICVLLERGDVAAAEQLRAGELTQAILAFRPTAVMSPESVRLQIDAIFAAEQERVANAAALAELLAPMLQARLSANASEPLPQATPRRPVQPIAADPPERRTTVVNIADFIDEMLVNDRLTPAAPRQRTS